MQHFIFKGNRTLIHKIMLIGAFVFTFIIGALTVISFIFYFLDLIEVDKFLIGDYIFLMLFPLSFYILAVILKKEGLSIMENQLFNTSFLLKKPLKSKEINTKNVCDICILKFNMAHKAGMGTSVDPEATVTNVEYQICLLNQNHSKRKLIFSTDSADEAKKIKDVIVENLGFNYATYNPPKSAKRRKR